MFKLVTGIAFILFSSFSFAQMKTGKVQFGEEIVLADCSFRGVAIAHNMAVVSGSAGKVFKASLNENSLQWKLLTINSLDTLEFRDVAILNEQIILLMSAGEGTASQIWKSVDGGERWKKEFQNTNEKAFFNGFDFWDNKRGVLLGDPVDKHIFLMQTNDGGSSWEKIVSKNLPYVKGKEYGFAASGTSIQCFEASKIRIGTGGDVARIIGSNDGGKSWEIQETPILQGNPSQGIFSIDYLNEEQAIAVGGDYAIDTLAGTNLISLKEDWLVTDASEIIKFKSCVKYLTDEIILITGTSGTAISYDGGESWVYLKELKGYHTIAFNKQLNRGILAGSEGSVLEFWLE